MKHNVIPKRVWVSWLCILLCHIFVFVIPHECSADLCITGLSIIMVTSLIAWFIATSVLTIYYRSYFQHIAIPCIIILALWLVESIPHWLTESAEASRLAVGLYLATAYYWDIALLILMLAAFIGYLHHHDYTTVVISCVLLMLTWGLPLTILYFGGLELITERFIAQTLPTVLHTIYLVVSNALNAAVIMFFVHSYRYIKHERTPQQITLGGPQ